MEDREQYRRLRLTIAYAGTHYSGWQIQEKPDAPPTIQGMLENVFRQVVQQAVRVHGAGRTDAGVHADGQVAHVDIPAARAGLDWRRICNSHLPDDICVLEAVPAAPDFHARFNACGKVYTYHIWQERTFLPPRIAPFVWPCGRFLDWERIASTIPFLLGRHDFAALQNAGTDIRETTRTLRRIELRPDLALLPHPASMAIQVEGDGFLKQMVRNMVGMLAAVGLGRLAPQDIPALLAGCERRRLSHIATAPARGLTLSQVLYDL